MSFGVTKDVGITVVVDNYAHMLLESSPGVERRGPGKEPMLAEHGLSIHIRLVAEGKDTAGCRIHQGGSPPQSVSTEAIPGVGGRCGDQPRAPRSRCGTP
jgi:hypothetical protein